MPPAYGARMRDRTRLDVEQWWRDVFDVSEGLWSTVTALHPHRALGAYEGWYVAWRDTGVHISAPSTAVTEEVASLRREDPGSLQTLGFWDAFAQRRGLVVIGPGVHRYLDVDPGAPDAVHEVAPSSLRALRDEVDDEDWSESGFEEALSELGTIAFASGGGAAALTELAGAPRNIGLLVTQAARGRGIGTEVGRAAASYAIRNHGYARWLCRDANLPSTRAARRLGFESYATQLAVRPRG